MSGRFDVVAAAGALRSANATSVHWPHRWTADGVTVDGDFTGGHLLHLAAAACVLNDVYREAAALGIEVDGVRVTAVGDFEPESCRSTGIQYSVDVVSGADETSLRHLLEVVDRVAEIPRALRAGISVRRVD
jgi:uncharacterized OsmC-like protein